MKVYRILIGLLPLTLAAACGGDDGDDDAAFVPLEDVPRTSAEAACEALRRCAGIVFDIFLPGEDCVANNIARLQEILPVIQQAVDDGRVVYNGEAAAACYATIRSADCAGLNERIDACDAIVTGSTALGESCSIHDECAGEAFCDFSATCPGTCRELAGEGEACNNPANCQVGLGCSPDEQICETPAGAGDLCGGPGVPDCEIGYLCVGGDPAVGEPGNCRVYDEIFTAGDGDDCDPSQGVLCQEGLSCKLDTIVPFAWSCAPRVGSGDACRPGIPEQCPDDEYCNVTNAMVIADMPGTCEPRPGDGELCGGPDNFVCAAGTRCNTADAVPDGTATCKALTEVGGDCAVDFVCYSESCVDGQCASVATCE